MTTLFASSLRAIPLSLHIHVPIPTNGWMGICWNLLVWELENLFQVLHTTKVSWHTNLLLRVDQEDDHDDLFIAVPSPDPGKHVPIVIPMLKG